MTDEQFDQWINKLDELTAYYKNEDQSEVHNQYKLLIKNAEMEEYKRLKEKYG